jgi:hypothetical protein
MVATGLPSRPSLTLVLPYDELDHALEYAKTVAATLAETRLWTYFEVFEARLDGDIDVRVGRLHVQLQQPIVELKDR